MSRDGVIAVIDDDPSVCRALSRLLLSAGFKVQLFCSGEDFLERNSLDQTGCIVLDMHLLGMNGLELQTRLIDEKRDFPIVFITAVDDASVRRTALGNGAIAFLSKPLDTAYLLELVETIMA
jgi:FixJ family two-component response regulator